MKNVKIGFLPLYIQLYDDFASGLRPGVEAYCQSVKEALVKGGAELVAADICRVKSEFEAAVSLFEREDVEAIVTLHLAYSPSLESTSVIASTSLPVIILDTTRDFCFDFEVKKGSTSYNHGIHGVQDFCNLLKRLGKDYSIFAGHYLNSDVVKRVLDAARAVKAARAISKMKVGTLGGAFDGMGDFCISDETKARLGVEVNRCSGEKILEIKKSVTDEAVRREYEADCKDNGCNIPYEMYAEHIRSSIAIRELIKKEGYTAFTMNFRRAGSEVGFDTVPFAEACKLMASGIGYAGEGDAINAALVGALMSSFDEVNFVEMFCPDWKNNTIYFNHMGECNASLMENRHMMTKYFAYGDVDHPVYMLGHMKAGQGCVLNMLPNAEGWFDVVIVEGEFMQLPEKLESFPETINGWFKPKTDVCSLLEKYSEAGGTHHSSFVYGVNARSLSLFAKSLGMKCTVI
ncbi:MAG: hypothetical protein IJ459_04285 [Clostridia bacterium]|nr:hypothetical protein [Clostridia bacterium]